MTRLQHQLLLIENDLDDQFLMKRALAKILPANSVYVVTSGDEGIAYMIGEGRFADRALFPFPTLLITDLNMEHGNGFDVLEFMQANPGWNVVPKIVFSRSSDEHDVQTAYVLGASACQLKSSGSAALEKQMREIIGYWATTQLPPVDVTGRLPETKSTGRRDHETSGPMLPAHPITVLVVEDDDRDYEFLRHMLRGTPLVSLLRVSDGEQAVNYFNGEGEYQDRRRFPQPDILILDLKLPKLSGIEVLAWLRKKRKAPNRISVLSGSDSDLDRRHAYNSGAHDYFLKPLSLGHIAALFGLREQASKPETYCRKPGKGRHDYGLR